MINTKTQTILWSVLEKYDRNSDYANFCDSISKFIQNNPNDMDITIVYKNLPNLDVEDRIKIDKTIGHTISNYFFDV